jgi:acetate---CoA ligase (ADP-forming)
MNLESFFNPKSIAIVGASAEEGTVGNVIAKNILTLGYSGQIYLVNPKHPEVLGKKCYSSLFDIDQPVDLAIIAIPAKFVVNEIEKNADKIKNYVIISAGFSEVGKEGKEREESLKKMADEKELHILGPNCLGFIIPEIKLNASFAGGMPKAGNIAFVSQSGALAVGIMDIAETKNIRFSTLISIGNKMDIDESEIIEHLADDSRTKVIGMYLEGIKSGKKFIETVSKVSKKKPIIILKAGKTEKSQKAISSHTGALAGSDDIMSAVFKKCGILRAQNLEEFFDLLNLISLSSAPINEEVAVITNAGGPGVLATDAFKDKKVKLSEIGSKSKEKLAKVLPPESSLENPIDMLGDAQEDRYDKTLKIIGKEINIGTLVCVLTPQDQTPVMKIARKIINFSKKNEKLVCTVFIGGGRVAKAIKKLKESGIANFDYPDQAINALESYYLWNVSKNSIANQSIEINPERKNKAFEIISKAKTENRNALDFQESKEIMTLYGLDSVDVLEYEENMDLGNIKFPAVLKVDSDKVLHKTDKNGIILDIKNPDELIKLARKMQNDFSGEKIIIQPMLPRQTELILGIKKDEIFGPVIVIGLGGIYTEIFKMIDFILPQTDIESIKAFLLTSRIGFLFKETRGQKSYDAEELARIVSGISNFALENNDDVAEFDINPLLIYNNTNGAIAVDIKIILN